MRCDRNRYYLGFFFLSLFLRNVDKSCSYLNDNVKSHCTQIYNYHRLLTWDEKTGLSLDLFKVSHENRLFCVTLDRDKVPSVRNVV